MKQNMRTLTTITSLFMFICLGTLPLSPPACAAPISNLGSDPAVTINNFSFENDVLAFGAFTNNVLSDWTVVALTSDLVGAYNPNTFNQPVPDGSNTAYINPGGSFSQDVGPLVANATYTFTVFVGQRNDIPLPAYNIQLLDATTQAVFASGTPSPAPASGDFVNFGLTFDSANFSSSLGHHILIQFSAPSASGTTLTQVNFDDVTLGYSADSTPTSTATNTPTQTPSNTPTQTGTPTDTATITPIPTLTPTQTPSNTPTQTTTPTFTLTPSVTPTVTPTQTPTVTPTVTQTPTVTPTRTPTNTPTPKPPAITGGATAGSNQVTGSGVPNGLNCIEIFDCGPNGICGDMDDILLGTGSTNSLGNFVIAVSPALVAGHKIFAKDICNGLTGPAITVTGPTMAPLMSPVMIVLLVATLSLIGLLRLGRMTWSE